MPAADLHSDADSAPDSGAETGMGGKSYGLWPKKWRWRISLVVLILIALVAGAAWLGRERIAADFIDETLAASGIDARYEIVSIGTTRQVIANVEVGDSDAPDFTADQIALDIDYTLGAPEVGGIELVRPRLYARLVEGRLSFGALDPLIYTDGEGSTGLPAINLTIADGRALIESEFGAIGAKIDGSGRLDEGFAGTLAATAPQIGTEDCRAESTTLYGDVTSANDRLRFDGPVRLRALTCAGANLASADIAARITLDEDLTSLEGDLGIAAADLTYADNRLASLSGPAELLWRFAGEGGQIVDVSHELTGTDIASGFGTLSEGSVDGRLRLIDDFARSEWRASVAGAGMRIEPNVIAPLANLRAATDGTFVSALLGPIETELTRALSNGSASADFTLRSDDKGLRVVVPSGQLRSAAGDNLLSLSRLNYSSTDRVGSGQIFGNFIAGGAGLPLINGRIEHANADVHVMRMSMAEYRVGENSLAIPSMRVSQGARGGVSFNGLVIADGDLPDGSVRGLEVPVEGVWSSRHGLSLGVVCTDLRVGSLQYAELALTDRAITLCPAEDGPMVRYSDDLQVAAVSEALDLAGSIGGTPARISAERAELRYPAPFALTGLNAVIGRPDNAVRLSAAQLDGAFGETIGGTFASGTAALDIVPLDLDELSGGWSFADGALTILDGAFLLSDRPEPELRDEPRFEPLYASGASLVLEGNAIRAEAPLLHPLTATLVTNVAVEHDLGSGSGRADIAVPGLTFNRGLQPDDLSILMRGYVAAADGTVAGKGEVTWEGDTLASSGTFGTDNLSFAAAFGPVDGMRGEITFTDLIALTTAPGQVIEIASVNPGIEALGGRIVYSMVDGQLITLEDARWPFMGGELILRPVTLDYGGGDGQSYVFELVGLDAATFVSEMELTNLGAEGTFDGTIPIFFDAEGNGSIRGGLLIARPGGGNVSYVGELSYEDLGQMANYAFQSLRSLDYRQMSVELNGDLAGEIITNFQIDGVSQGEGASQNFVTRRLAKLPIRFNINVRSDSFTQLTTVVKGFFDPTVFDNDAVRRSLGLDVTEVGPEARVPPPEPEPPPTIDPGEAQRPDESTVQPPESDSMP